MANRSKDLVLYLIDNDKEYSDILSYLFKEADSFKIIPRSGDIYPIIYELDNDAYDINHFYTTYSSYQIFSSHRELLYKKSDFIFYKDNEIIFTHASLGCINRYDYLTFQTYIIDHPEMLRYYLF